MKIYFKLLNYLLKLQDHWSDFFTYEENLRFLFCLVLIFSLKTIEPLIHWSVINVWVRMWPVTPMAGRNWEKCPAGQTLLKYHKILSTTTKKLDKTNLMAHHINVKDKTTKSKVASLPIHSPRVKGFKGVWHLNLVWIGPLLAICKRSTPF